MNTLDVVRNDYKAHTHVVVSSNSIFVLIRCNFVVAYVLKQGLSEAMELIKYVE